MILQSLYEYYQRKAADPGSKIAPDGFEWKEIPFIIVIDKNGKFVSLQDTRELVGKKKRAKAFLVPQSVIKRASGIKANLLWDKLEYSIGIGDKPAKHQDFKDRIFNELKDFTDKYPLSALLSFIDNDPVGQIKASMQEEEFNSFIEENPFITFRIKDDASPIIIDSLMDQIKETMHGVDPENSSICLISGTHDTAARLHQSIKGVRGTNKNEGSIVSFNSKAFCSYGKEQGDNALVGEKAAFAYTTALNTMLGKDSKNKFFSGDTSIVFWSGKNTNSYDLEPDMAMFFDPPKDNPDKAVEAVRNLYNAVNSGILNTSEDNIFHVLGLAPNVTRISIRFWKTGTTEYFAKHIKQHFDDIEIIKSNPKDPDFIPLNQMLRATALKDEMDNVPPNLAASVVSSILDARPYPVSLMQQCIRRIRAEQHVTRVRAAILKAYINRFNRSNNKNHKEVTVSLDKSNNSPAYRLGRLFAVLEKIQEEAQGEATISATIRERFYGAASSTPVTVFPQLLKLTTHHLAKISNPGAKVVKNKLLDEIIDGIHADVPAHLSMEEQATFAIGYYHQRQDLFTSKQQQ